MLPSWTCVLIYYWQGMFLKMVLETPVLKILKYLHKNIHDEVTVEEGSSGDYSM